MTSMRVAPWLAFLVCLLPRSLPAQDTVEPGLRCLRAAYPQHVCAVERNTLVFCSGQRLPYDDARVKTPEQRLDEPDLEDTFAQPYPRGDSSAPGEGSDPGRIRYTPLFDAMYGATETAVRKRLARVPWLPSVANGSVQISTANDVHLRLREVSDALERLAPALRAEAAKLAGSFNYRTVAGTERKSAHAYGFAIDVAPQLGDYWRWREKGVDPPRRYRNRMPLPIVEAFEAHGFIWGGRWSHYDTMHFEYRPELLGCQSTTPAAAPPKLAAPPQPSAAEPVHFAWAARADSRPLAERIAPPSGYQRIPLAADSFGAWLRQLPLRAGRSTVHLHDGSAKPDQSLHVAVLDIDTGRADLQQCADAVMRLRAEYLFSRGRAQEVCFHAASGDALPYAAYRKGLRPPPGRGSPWTPRAAPDASWAGFRSYLDRVFNIANSASLSRELIKVGDSRAIEPGQVFIESANARRYGHAVIVLDVAENAAGERVFVIAQSYMPAQDIHVLINPGDPQLSPWYRAPANGSLASPEWAFPASSLKRFDETSPICR